MNPKCQKQNRCSDAIRVKRNIFMCCDSCRGLKFSWDRGLNSLYLRLERDIEGLVGAIKEAKGR